MKKKILLIAFGNSIHTKRWIENLKDSDCEVHLFSSFSIPGGPEIEYPAWVHYYNMHRTEKKIFYELFKDPMFKLRLLLSFDYKKIKNDFFKSIREREVFMLANLINKNDFVLIHTLHTQVSAGMLSEALPLLKKKLPVWINTVWGSDLYLHQHIKSSREQLVRLLPLMDLYWGEGRRDYDLARSLGFKGDFLPPIPAFGGVDADKLKSLPYTPPSQRKVILVKGYQNVVGRATVAFAALERCADLLKGYEIELFSIENQVITTVAEIFSRKYNVPVRFISGVPYSQILEMHSRARCSIYLSTSDGLPAAFIESISCGAFPIQSNTSMAYEWAENGKTAIFTHPEDPIEVANALRKVLTDDQFVDDAAVINRNRVFKHLNSSDISRQIRDIYQSIIDGKPVIDMQNISSVPMQIVEEEDADHKESLAAAKKIEPLVSVVTIAYKHENFIRQTIEGVLQQKCSFPIEFIIGDDCSPDNTASVIAEYAEKYPDIIVPVLRKSNIGALPNLMDLISRTKGKYVAICDGDDYWTDPEKLQKQVDFLETHPEYTVCSHKIRVFYDDNVQPDSVLNPLAAVGAEGPEKQYLTIHDLIRSNTVPSLSVLYRWSIPRKLPAWMSKFKVGDYPLLLMHADKGLVGVLPDIMGAYRKHAASSWFEHNKTVAQLNEYLQLLSHINETLSFKYAKDFQVIFDWIQNVDLPAAAEREAANAAGEISEKFQPDNIPQRSFSMKIFLKKCIKKMLKMFIPLKLQYKLQWIWRGKAWFEELKAQFEMLNYDYRNTVQSLQAAVQSLQSLQQRLAQDENKLQLQQEFLQAEIRQERAQKLDFNDALFIEVAKGNFRYLPDNYDALWCDPKAIKAWLESVQNNFQTNWEFCRSQLSEEALGALGKVYSLLADNRSKELLVRLIAWRILGFSKIVLLDDSAVAAEENFYRDLEQYKAPGLPSLQTFDFELEAFDLHKLGFPLSCYAIPCSIVMDFLRLQYENDFVKIDPGDVVLDCGGCWGDTALLFAHKCAPDGMVYSFEFIERNIDVFHKNLDLNPDLKPLIKICPNPVAERSGLPIPVVDKGTASTINSQEGVEYQDVVYSVSIDDFVKQEQLERVDLIKMDIEGAEMAALNGAAETIKRFRPKLAIAVYHKSDDIWSIPLSIVEMLPDYTMYLKHNSRSSLETVLLAIPEEQK